ncbi:MAG: glycosyltransferase family 2 protein [Bacteroidota bacterium]
MPAYNAEKYIPNAIESILNQTYDHLELLICDDASTDRTRKKILNYRDKRIRTFTNEKNIGYLKTVNFLFSKANGQYITFQDADDWSEFDRLELQINEFVNNKNLGICGTYAQYHNSSGQNKTLKKITETSHEYIKNSIIYKSQFCGASIMIRDIVLEKIGGYRLYFDRIGSEDYDWSARIVESFESQNIPKFLYNVRQTPNSITRDIINYKQLISNDIVKLLIHQRRSGLIDSLESKDYSPILRIENQIKDKIDKDKSYFLRKKADVSWYNGNMKTYLFSSFLAFRKDPLKSINIKYFIISLFRLVIR